MERVEKSNLYSHFLRAGYGRKNALAAADMLNGVVLLFFDGHELPLLRILADRGNKCCGNREHHEYALCLEVEDTGHTKTKAKPPRTNDICERFNKTRKDGFYPAAFRKKAYRSIKELQAGLDEWVRQYNMNGPIQESIVTGKRRCRRSPVRSRWPKRSSLAMMHLADSRHEFFKCQIMSWRSQFHPLRLKTKTSAGVCGGNSGLCSP